MKNKNKLPVFCLLALLSVCYAACDLENPVMEKWWDEEEQGYNFIVKNIPIVTIERVVEEKIVYETVFIQLPPEIIYENKDIVETIYVQLPPEVIYETIVEYIDVEKIIYQTVVQEVEKVITLPPTEEEIIKYIKEHPDEIIKIIKEDHYIYNTIKQTIIQELTKEEIIEIIKQIPPETILEYLTKEQIEYIVKQQPPELILQTINILAIEYIIFAGESMEYNGPPGPGGSTALNEQEINSNDANIRAIAKYLNSDPDTFIILHGHANPVLGTPEEEQELKIISEGRAKAVAAELLGELGAGFDKAKRMTVTGYGGGRNLSVTGSTTYAGLNRRVEMILFKINTVKGVF